MVDRYVQMLNIDHLPQDSLLVMETAITTNLDSKDTIWMRRWYAAGEKHRIEVWIDKKLNFGLTSNGKDRFRNYRSAYETWEAITKENFSNRSCRATTSAGRSTAGARKAPRSPGTAPRTSKGTPCRWSRWYAPRCTTATTCSTPPADCSPSSSRPTARTTAPPRSAPAPRTSSGRASTNTCPVTAPHLLPSLESFMRSGTLTVLSTTMHLEPRNDELFNKD